MESLQITALSSRGQIVIPQSIRERLRLKEGEKFAVVGENDTIILKKLQFSFDGVEDLLKKTQNFAKDKRISKQQVKEAILSTRKR